MTKNRCIEGRKNHSWITTEGDIGTTFCEYCKKPYGELKKQVEGKFTLMFLTSEMARKWKAGVWKHTYTNFYPSAREFRCLSGDYIYVIRLRGVTEIVRWSRVPKGYRKCLKKSELVYRNRADLVKIMKRNLRKTKKQDSGSGVNGKN